MSQAAHFGVQQTISNSFPLQFSFQSFHQALQGVQARRCSS
jgi:hypothetical protein